MENNMELDKSARSVNIALVSSTPEDIENMEMQEEIESLEKKNKELSEELDSVKNNNENNNCCLYAVSNNFIPSFFTFL